MDLIKVGEVIGAKMSTGTDVDEISLVKGHYDIECRDSEGNLLWSDGFDNLVPTGGLNELLVSGIYSLTSYMGLISASGYTAVSGTDTMTSHSGWLEASSSAAPGYGTTRPSVAWSALPTTGQLVSAAATFVASGASGTIEGAFIVTGTGANATVGNTTGVLFSAGALTTPQPVIGGNTVTMTYTLNLTG
jgi:hypothetical protein